MRLAKKVIGTIGLRDMGEKRGYLKRMAVEREYRGQGVAQALLTTLLTFAKSHGYHDVYLSTSADMTAAHKFYDKAGFKKISSLPL